MLRSDLLNFLISKHRLQSYLELGLQQREHNFDKINCPIKYSVDCDENSHPDFLMTTDEFFEQNRTYYDIFFIDASHYEEQVEKDFHNCYKWLKPGGWIVLHDVNPLEQWYTITPRPKLRGHWQGSVYRFASALTCKKWTVDIDCGCLCIPHQDQYVIGPKPTWEEFNKDRRKLLNLISWESFIQLKL